MNLLRRIRRIERRASQVLSAADQAALLRAFLEIEPIVRGKPVTAEEIAEARARFAKPIKRPTAKEWVMIVADVERMVLEAIQEKKREDSFYHHLPLALLPNGQWTHTKNEYKTPRTP